MSQNNSPAPDRGAASPAPPPGVKTVTRPDGLVEVHGMRVLPEWIDFNGHLNVGFYAVAFDQALDRVAELLGYGFDYVQATNNSTMVLESHMSYLAEVLADAPLRFTFQILDMDGKKMHVVMEMHHATEGFLSAVSEQMIAHVDLDIRRTAPFPDDLFARINGLFTVQAQLPRPAQAGRAIGIRRKA